jgi:uncharacterized protein
MSDWARPIVHFQIEARDPAAQAAFYRALFNWQIDDSGMFSIEPGLGGPEPGPAGHIRQSDRSRVNLFVQVLDLAASLERVTELGGAVTTGPFDVPGGPTLAFVEDPEGNPLGLVQQ